MLSLTTAIAELLLKAVLSYPSALNTGPGVCALRNESL